MRNTGLTTKQELEYLIMGCNCSRLQTGVCNPNKCFPKLMKLTKLDKVEFIIVECPDGIKRKFKK